MTSTRRRAPLPATNPVPRTSGTIGWIGLTTTDLDAARTFYAGVFGWEYVVVNTPVGDYLVCCRREQAAAGLLAHDANLAAAGMAPGWTTWFRVGDLDAALSTADAQGAKLTLGPLNLRARAQAALLTDPFGARFGLLAGPTRVGLHVGTDHGEPCWAEMVTADPEDTADFYGHVLGWSTHEDPAGYTTFCRGRLHVAGMIHPDDLPVAAPGWLPYFAVADCRVAVATVLRLGGSTVTGPTPVALGTFAVVADPRDTVFVAFQPAAPS